MTIERSVLQRTQLFSELSPELIDSFASHATTRIVAQGETVFKQGDEAAFFYLLLHGRLKVTQVTADGQQIIVRVVNPGDLFGFAHALRRAEYPGTAIAVVEAGVVAWPARLWPSLVEKNPHLAMSALRSIGQRLDEAHTRIREMSTQEVEGRVAHTVLRLATQAGRPVAQGVAVDFPITRRDIAEMTGTTLYSVSRILSAWEARGLVQGGRQRLVVLDLKGLQCLADAPGI